MNQTRALGLLAVASLVLVAPSVAASSYVEITNNDGSVEAEIVSESNPLGLGPFYKTGYCFGYDKPNVAGSHWDGPGEGLDYAVVLFCNGPGYMCTNNVCQAYQWDSTDCRVEVYAYTGWLYWQEAGWSGGGSTYGGWYMEWDGSAMQDESSCA